MTKILKIAYLNAQLEHLVMWYKTNVNIVIKCANNAKGQLIMTVFLVKITTFSKTIHVLRLVKLDFYRILLQIPVFNVKIIVLNVKIAPIFVLIAFKGNFYLTINALHFAPKTIMVIIHWENVRFVQKVALHVFLIFNACNAK